MSLSKLKVMSNKYGENPEYVLAGGGNTSYKDSDFIYVKGSGCSLATIDEEGFVKLDRKKIGEIFTNSYPDDADEREAAVLKDLMDSRTDGQGSKRPSVETLLHNVIPFSYILHIHPALVNGITCARKGKEAFEKLFSEKGIWIEPIMPGYILAKRVRDEIEAFEAKNGKIPVYIFLENHGVFIGADNVSRIDILTDELFSEIKPQISRFPDFSDDCREEKANFSIPGMLTEVLCDNESIKFVSSREAFDKIIITFTPDHMVYCGDKTLFIESAENIDKNIEKCIKKDGKLPKIIGVKNFGIICTGTTEKEAFICRAICKDAMKIAVYAESFGGGKSLPDSLVYAINNWEVERYRKSVSAS